MATFIHAAKYYDIHNVVATFLQYGKIRVDHIDDAHTISLANLMFHFR